MNGSPRRGPRVIALAAVLLSASACSAPMRRARTSPAEPPSGREVQARVRHAAPRCSPAWRLLFPGLGEICLREDEEGAALMGVGAAELASAIALAERHGFDHPSATLSFSAFTDLYLYGLVAPALDRELAVGLRFVPQDSLAELAMAPFNVDVLGETYVWAGVLTTAAAVTVALAVGGREKGDPNLFGYRLSPIPGYAAAGATYAALFEHVAIAEEAIFRGWAQSALARRWGEGWGWAAATALFGLAHVPNALALETPTEQQEYVLIAVPIITAVGGYLGASYRWSGYSLAPPVALHFWYDFLLSMGEFIADPSSSTLSARITLPW